MELFPEGVDVSRISLLISLLAAYAALVIPFSSYLKNRPVALKLGYVPDARVLKVAAADHRFLLAELSVVKVLFYFGTLFEKTPNRIAEKPEYFNMYRTLETAVKLDPYNMDAYYFTQAAFTWELGRAKDVNKMLEYGMKYRTWDHMLPYYAAFNHAYFLKDYKSAALLMRKAAEISGDPLMATLAARYFHEANQSDLGIIFLETMEKGAKDKNVKKVYVTRKKALLAVMSLNDALSGYRKEYQRMPEDLSELVAAGFIDALPPDPYGGRFYLSEDGIIRSTSKFAFRSQ